jgi:uncharacterized peroxidase-related enzyme
MQGDWRSAELSPADRVMLEFAEKLTGNPGAMTAQDAQALRDAGFDERGMLDIVLVTAFFNYVNRVADALGIPLEPGWEEQWPPQTA